MKRVIVEHICDICKHELANQEIKYKGKARYMFCGKWHKIDICEDCYREFVTIRKRSEDIK